MERVTWETWGFPEHKWEDQSHVGGSQPLLLGQEDTWLQAELRSQVGRQEVHSTSFL